MRSIALHAAGRIKPFLVQAAYNPAPAASTRLRFDAYGRLGRETACSR